MPGPANENDWLTEVSAHGRKLWASELVAYARYVVERATDPKLVDDREARLARSLETASPDAAEVLRESHRTMLQELRENADRAQPIVDQYGHLFPVHPGV